MAIDLDAAAILKAQVNSWTAISEQAADGRRCEGDTHCYIIGRTVEKADTIRSRSKVGTPAGCHFRRQGVLVQDGYSAVESRVLSAKRPSRLRVGHRGRAPLAEMGPPLGYKGL